MAEKNLGKLLNPLQNGELGKIVRRAREMGELAEVLARALPEAEAANLVAANIRDDGELVVLCRSPAWAARFRFEEQALLSAARAHDVRASRVTIRVARC